MNHFEQLKKLLEENKVYPIIGNWNKHKIKHFKERPDKSKINAFVTEMNNTLNNKNGLYAYYKNKKLLYVGKGKPLRGRIVSHFKEAYLEGRHRDELWPTFFREHAGLLELYWIELENESVRISCESLITSIKEPYFFEFKKLFYQHKKKNNIQLNNSIYSNF